VTETTEEPGAGTSPAPEGYGLYVYGVVSGDLAGDALDGIESIERDEPVLVIADGGVAALASRVPLAEFGEGALEAGLLDEAWLEEKARGHDRVLAAAIERTPVLPFRFGSVFLSEDHVRRMLAERPELGARLRALGDAVEVGVTAVVDEGALRDRLAGAQDPAEPGSSEGRAYMERRQRERQAAEQASDFAAACAQECHERLAAAGAAARANPLRGPEQMGPNRVMILNGAYLVPRERVEAFSAVVADLRSEYADDGIAVAMTGPWPPYNFAEEPTE